MTSPAKPWAVVTGASRGIGRATVQALLSRGINVAQIVRSLPTLNEAVPPNVVIAQSNGPAAGHVSAQAQSTAHGSRATLRVSTMSDVETAIASAATTSHASAMGSITGAGATTLRVGSFDTETPRAETANSAALDASIQAGAETRCYVADLSDLAQVEAIGRQIAGELQPAYLFNVAGIVQRAAVEQLTTSDLQAQINVNLLAPVLLARQLLGSIRAADRGAVINVGSISSTLGTAGQAAYNASKWGLVGFTKCLALELTDTRAHTVIVLPGAVDTDMLTGSRYPARMSAQEVATTLVHYALDASPAHNGGVVEMFGV